MSYASADALSGLNLDERQPTADRTTIRADTTAASWNVEQTAQWVQGLFEKTDGGAQCVAIFKEEQIRARDKMAFTNECLREAGIRAGPRAVILAAYNELMGRGAAKLSLRRETDEMNFKMHQALRASREGVSIRNPLVSPRHAPLFLRHYQPQLIPICKCTINRTETCRHLETELDRYGAVLCRSPPFSGKTSLAELYQHYLKQRGRNVIRVSFLGLRDPHKLDEFWKRECGGASWEDHMESPVPLTVILDEVQIMYSLGQSNPFWNAFKLAMTSAKEKTTKTRILVFAAFGEKPGNRVGRFTATPVIFDRTLDLKDMVFTRQEYDDLVVRCASTNNSACLTIGQDAQDVIWNATNGHPGLVKLCLDKIVEKLQLTAWMDTNSEEIDQFGLILALLLSHDFFIALKGTRAAARQVFSLEETDYLRQLLAAGDDGISADTHFPEELASTGFIGFHSTNRVRLAAPLFRGVLLQRFYSSARPMHSVLVFEDFLKKTIAGMDPTVWTQSLGSGSAASAALYERRRQMEFYRAATSLLASEHTISPDVGEVFGIKGFLDFFVDGLKWGIELLREGDREQERAARFKQGGMYHKMLSTGHMNHFAILDFHAGSLHKKERTDQQHVWYIFYDPDYSKATLKRTGHPDEVLMVGTNLLATPTNKK